MSGFSFNDAHRLAQSYAANGIPAFPLAISWDERKQATNKRPLCPHGFKDATTDAELLRDLFHEARAGIRGNEVIGVGVWPGGADMLVLDVDVKGAVSGTDSLHELTAEQGRALPETRRSDTPSGGYHIWFLKPAGVHVTNHKLRAGIDVRSDDGYVVAPGTCTPWGNWTFDTYAGEVFAQAPAWLLALLGTRAADGDATQALRLWTDFDRSKLHPGTRAALEALEALGGHSPYLAPDGSIHVTRPGKGYGTSATVGHIGPDKVKVWSSEWPGLDEGVYDAEELTDIATDPSAEDPATHDEVPYGDAFRENYSVGAQEASGRPGGGQPEGGEGETQRSAQNATGFPRPSEKEVVKAQRRLLAEDEARHRIRRAEDERRFTIPGATLDLAEELAVPDTTQLYRIDGLLSTGGNMMVAAARKTGKTTFALNLLKALADCEPFLGYFGVRALSGRVALWNFEVYDRQLREWIRRAKFVHPERACVWNLRGHRLPLESEVVREAAVAWLREREVSVLIVDPLARAFQGDENDNSAASRYLELLDAVKDDAGIQELALMHHIGKGEGQHGRGASRFEDWPDSLVYLSKNGDASRVLRADGRDVDVPEGHLLYDESSMSYTYVEDTDVADAREDQRDTEMLDIIRAHQDLDSSEMYALAQGATASKGRRAKRLEREGRVCSFRDSGDHRKTRWHTPDHQAHPDCLNNHAESDALQ